MARNFMYVYERIYKEANVMKREFEKLPINGRHTSRADVKCILKIISDSTYQVAQECSVLVSYPRMRIEGRRVVLGEPTIMLPDCRLISMEELKKIECGGDNKIMGSKNPFGTCVYCGKKIIWIRTKAGKNMPVNPQLITYRRPEAGKKAGEKLVTSQGEVVAADRTDSRNAEGCGYISHFATCTKRRR